MDRARLNNYILFNPHLCLRRDAFFVVKAYNFTKRSHALLLKVNATSCKSCRHMLIITTTKDCAKVHQGVFC